jgi:hypothetical protein
MASQSAASVHLPQRTFLCSKNAKTVLDGGRYGVMLELVAGARNYLKLRLSPTGYNVLRKLVAASERGLYRVAA